MNEERPYRAFAELARAEHEGIDYDIILQQRSSPIAVMAPHGGHIEHFTTDIARAIAGDEYSFYSFRALKEDGEYRLHITSTLFDEPQAIALASGSDSVLTIHGAKEEEHPLVIGGLDFETNKLIAEELAKVGFGSCDPADYPRLAGANPNNLCNRGRSGKGTQLELGRALRRSLITDPIQMAAFVQAVRTGLPG